MEQLNTLVQWIIIGLLSLGLSAFVMGILIFIDKRRGYRD